LLTFAELEFVLCEAPGWPRMRAQLNGNPPDTPQVLQAGAASLLARGLTEPETPDTARPSALVRRLASALVDCPNPVGISLIMESKLGPGVYCSTPDGRRVLVSIEMPGVARFQELPTDVPPVAQAMGLVEKLLKVEGGVVAVKAIGQPGVLLRRRGEVWELGDNSRDPNDLDSFFQPVSRGQALGTVEAYLARFLALEG